MINNDKIKENIKSRLPEYLCLQGIDINNPFLCLNPEHIDHKPSMNITPDRQHVKCFSCGAYYDIFDLIEIQYNLSEFSESLKKAKEIFNNNYQPDYKIPNNQILPLQEKEEVKTEKNYTDYFNAMSKNLILTDYPNQRGLSVEVLNKFNIGYDPDINSLIIPTSDYSYTARNVLSNIKNENRYRKTGKVHIFNLQALKTATKPIVIVEGELDCLSIIEAGGESIGLGSTSNVNLLINYLKENKPKQPFIIALDNDDAGQKTTQSLKKWLTSLSISYMDNLTFNPYKDANELLCKGGEELRNRILTATEGIKNIMENIKDEELENYKKKSTGYLLNAFLENIETNKREPIPTGYNRLDCILNGGLVGGLYGIGAISSLGKTTFILQMSDQIAQGGKDVLIFSLEMKKETLISKSLSRIMYQRAGSPELTENYEPIPFKGKRNKPKETEVLSSQEIVQGCKYGTIEGDLNRTEVSPAEKEALERAITDYKRYGEHLYIFEPQDVKKYSYGLTIKQIEATVHEHISITGNTPVVIVDYLQLIQPKDDKGNDKSNTDFTIHGLKAIADTYNTPVIAISSFNRNSYNAPVNLASFKESGGIEYSCDVLIGLQYKLNFKESKGASPEDLLEAKKKTISNVQAVILKNRNGQTGAIINYKFTGKYNTFTEGLKE